MSDTQPTIDELDELLAATETEVAQTEDVERSASLLIGRLSEGLSQIADDAETAATDPDAPEAPEAESTVLTTVIEKLRSFAERLDASQGSLGAAIVAATPAAPDAPAPPITQEQVDAAVEAGTVTLPAAPAVEGESFLEGDFEPEVQPDPPAGTADLGTPSEGNENDPAFNSGTVDLIDETVVENEPVVDGPETTESTDTE